MIKISQSLIKDFKKYFYKKNGGGNYEGNNCGLLLKAKYIDKIVFEPPSDSMKEGIYFEYLATGSLPKSGEVPQPVYTQRGELTAAYKRVVESSLFFKEIINHYGIKIIEKGYTIENEDMICTIDILAEWNNQVCIIDTKWSGLIDDKWSELGWNTDSLPSKQNLMLQGVHYKYLVNDVMGIDAPFYFFVFNSKDSADMKIINQEVDPDYFETHKSEVYKIKGLIENEIKQGFTAFPNYRNCRECPLKDTCTEKEEFPKPITVYYGGEEI